MAKHYVKKKDEKRENIAHNYHVNSRGPREFSRCHREKGFLFWCTHFLQVGGGGGGGVEVKQPHFFPV